MTIRGQQGWMATSILLVALLLGMTMDLQGAAEARLASATATRRQSRSARIKGARTRRTQDNNGDNENKDNENKENGNEKENQKQENEKENQKQDNEKENQKQEDEKDNQKEEDEKENQKENQEEEGEGCEENDNENALDPNTQLGCLFNALNDPAGFALTEGVDIFACLPSMIFNGGITSRQGGQLGGDITTVTVQQLVNCLGDTLGCTGALDDNNNNDMNNNNNNNENMNNNDNMNNNENMNFNDNMNNNNPMPDNNSNNNIVGGETTEVTLSDLFDVP